jgi:hypothetical protein
MPGGARFAGNFGERRRGGVGGTRPAPPTTKTGRWSGAPRASWRLMSPTGLSQSWSRRAGIGGEAWLSAYVLRVRARSCRCVVARAHAVRARAAHRMGDPPRAGVRTSVGDRSGPPALLRRLCGLCEGCIQRVNTIAMAEPSRFGPQRRAGDPRPSRACAVTTRPSHGWELGGPVRTGRRRRAGESISDDGALRAGPSVVCVRAPHGLADSLRCAGIGDIAECPDRHLFPAGPRPGAATWAQRIEIGGDGARKEGIRVVLGKNGAEKARASSRVSFSGKGEPGVGRFPSMRRTQGTWRYCT